MLGAPNENPEPPVPAENDIDRAPALKPPVCPEFGVDDAPPPKSDMDGGGNAWFAHWPQVLPTWQMKAATALTFRVVWWIPILRHGNLRYNAGS